MRYRISALCLTWLVFAPVWAGSGSERITTYLEELGSMRAEFTQTLYDEDLNRLEDSRGTMYLKRPGQFRWDYALPYAQSIVSNGKTLWVYDSELAQVTVKQLDAAVENSPSMLLTSDQPLEDHFTILELPKDDGSVWIELRPKSTQATFANIRIKFLQDELNTMELVDGFGQITHLEFTGLQKNPELDPGLFQFSPPSGADVISDTNTLQ